MATLRALCIIIWFLLGTVVQAHDRLVRVRADAGDVLEASSSSLALLFPPIGLRAGPGLARRQADIMEEVAPKCRTNCTRLTTALGSCFDADPSCNCNARVAGMVESCLNCQIQDFGPIAPPSVVFAYSQFIEDYQQECRALGQPVRRLTTRFVPGFLEYARSIVTLRSVFFLFLVMGGMIGLPLLLLTVIFVRRVSRHPVFINFCFSWVLYSIVLALLYFVRKENDLATDGPLLSLCQVQAALVDGALVYTQMTTIALVIQIGCNLRESTHGAWKTRWIVWRTIGLILVPYVVGMAFVVRTHVQVHRPTPPGSPNQVVANLLFYCKLLDNSTLRSVAAYSLVISALTLALEVFILVHLFRHWRRFRSSTLRKLPKGSNTDLTVIIRIAIFSLMRIIAVIGTAFVLLDPLVALWAEFMHSLSPFLAFLVFVTSKDILRVWTFRSPPKSDTEVMTSGTSFAFRASNAVIWSPNSQPPPTAIFLGAALQRNLSIEKPLPALPSLTPEPGPNVDLEAGRIDEKHRSSFFTNEKRPLSLADEVEAEERLSTVPDLRDRADSVLDMYYNPRASAAASYRESRGLPLSIVPPPPVASASVMVTTPQGDQSQRRSRQVSISSQSRLSRVLGGPRSLSRSRTRSQARPPPVRIGLDLSNQQGRMSQVTESAYVISPLESETTFPVSAIRSPGPVSARPTELELGSDEEDSGDEDGRRETKFEIVTIRPPIRMDNRDNRI